MYETRTYTYIYILIHIYIYSIYYIYIPFQGLYKDIYNIYIVDIYVALDGELEDRAWYLRRRRARKVPVDLLYLCWMSLSFRKTAVFFFWGGR